MEGDPVLVRGQPTAPYRPAPATLRIPARALEATISLLRRVGEVESCVFWYGERVAGGDATVKIVIAPRQVMRWGNFDVPPEAMSEMASHVDEDCRPLAQIHTHPGRAVEHSAYDDRMISSRRILSLVFPHYGRWKSHWPKGIGIHEWQDGFWHLLTVRQASDRTLVDTSGSIKVLDLRR